MYEHDFGIGTHIALMIAEDVSRRRSWADGQKTKQMSAQPKKGVLSWIPYEMHSTLKLMVEYLTLIQPLLEQHGLNQLFKTK